MSELRAGSVLSGRFELVRLAGSGAMGVVWEALDQQSGQLVAVKLLRPFAGVIDAAERLRREAMVLMELNHPAIVKLFDVTVREDGTLVLAMEMLRGRTLREHLHDVGTMAPAELVPIVEGLCSALDQVHRAGVVHRDLKPDNIFLVDAATREPGSAHAKLIDFGIAKIFWDSPMTGPGGALGTPRYMTPDQLREDIVIDGRSDQYALAVVVYEALAGTLPYPRGCEIIGAVANANTMPLRQVMRDAPAAIEAALAKALSHRPEDRFPTARAFAKAFSDAAG